MVYGEAESTGENASQEQVQIGCRKRQRVQEVGPEVTCTGSQSSGKSARIASNLN